MMVDISVLMSVYKNESANNLIECLDSLVNQTYQAEEVVLVLDGPIPEALSAIIEEYKTKLNIIVQKLVVNQGLGKALNHGLRFCNNELIARMDTDDICVPERFEKQISEFQKDQSLQLLGSSIIEFSNHSERMKNLPLDYVSIKNFSKFKNPFNHMSVMFTKQSVLTVGGYRHHLYMEDYNLWLRMIANNTKMKNTDQVLVKARVNDATLLKRRGLNYLSSEIQLFKLKRKLDICKTFEGLYIFFMRAIPRLLPVFILKILYAMDRK